MDDDEEEEGEEEDEYPGSPQKNYFHYRNLCMVASCNDLSSCATAAVANAALKDLGYLTSQSMHFGSKEDSKRKNSS